MRSQFYAKLFRWTQKSHNQNTMTKKWKTNKPQKFLIMGQIPFMG